MTVLAWAIIAVVYFVVVPIAMAIANRDNLWHEWWEPIVGWTLLNAAAAAVCGAIYALALAVQAVIGGAS